MEDGGSARHIQELTDNVSGLFISRDRLLPNSYFQGIAGVLRRKFKTLYPWFNVGFEGWLLAHNVAYLFDRTPFYRPWLAWVGVDLRRLNSNDFVRLTVQSVVLHLRHLDSLRK